MYTNGLGKRLRVCSEGGFCIAVLISTSDQIRKKEDIHQMASLRKNWYLQRDLNSYSDLERVMS